MIKSTGVAHFSIPVSDLKKSVEFYKNVVGLTVIRSDEKHAFLDAGGHCVILCRETPPINKEGNLDFVHHSFMVSPEQYQTINDHLEKSGVKVLYSENLEGGSVNGPRTYFRDPDGTRLEFINLTSYNANPATASAPRNRNRKEGG
jgi:extradiol dioxygenase family protein